MTNTSENEQRSYIDRVLQRTGWSPTELARRASLDHYLPPCLVASTGDASLLRPYVVDDDRTVIKGVVTHSFRARN